MWSLVFQNLIKDTRYLSYSSDSSTQQTFNQKNLQEKISTQAKLPLYYRNDLFIIVKVATSSTQSF